MYLDETWANARDGKEKMWVEDDPTASGGTKGGIRKPSGKGSRLIILHGELMGLRLFFRVRRQLVITMTK